MRFLQEISQIITNTPRQREDIFVDRALGRPSDKVAKLYEGIRLGNYLTDQSAVQDIYGDQKKQATYLVLKSRLRTRLLNSLFVLDPKPPRYSEGTRAFYRCHKGLFWASVLLRFGARNVAIQIAERTLEEATAYQFTSIVLELLFFLRGHHSLLGNHEKFEDFNSRLRLTLEMLEAEFLSREYLERVTITFATTEAEQPEIATLARTYSDALGPIRKRFDNFSINLNYYRLRALGLQIAQDYPAAIEICEEAALYLRGNPRLALDANLGEFALQKLSCLLRLRDYERGKATAEECATHFPTGSNNWFTYMEYFFLLSMHTEHFEEAEQVYAAATTHARFAGLTETRKEKWKIFELYLHYVIQSDPEAASKPIGRAARTFDRKRVLRMVPTYSRDKYGYNIALLVMHILYLLDQNDLGEIINRMEALKAYRSRYLTMKKNRQSALFFKLLLVMEANSFDYKRTKQKGEKYYQQLLVTAPGSEEFSETLQVLPFDWLWLHVLEKLKGIRV
jgi:tetratricopeptide (TPR) repeat protein